MTLLLPAVSRSGAPLVDVIHCVDALGLLRALPDRFIQTIVTSPPYYGLRDYGVEGQIGLEETPEQYVTRLVDVFREARRVLRDDGTLWLNLGDSYVSAPSGKVADPFAKSTIGASKTAHIARSASEHKLSRLSLPEKNLIGIPWMVAFALRADGWYLRSEIIWHKPAPMPESVKDRPTKSHEQIFLLSKSPTYYYDWEAIAEPAKSGKDLGLLRGLNAGKDDKVAWHAESILKRQQEGVDSRTAGNDQRNKRSVWTVNTQPYSEAHFATFPPKLIEPCILAGSRPGDVVFDPFMGAGTTALVARNLKRHYLGSEINPDYIKLIKDRLRLPFEEKQVKPATLPLDDLPLFTPGESHEKHVQESLLEVES